jgi:hypothetical protein
MLQFDDNRGWHFCLFFRVLAAGTLREPALRLGNTRMKSLFSLICAIAPPHPPPNN